MRKGISKVVDGVRKYDIQRIIGKYYNNVWFTNTKDIALRILRGSRNCKKSKNLLGYEVIIKILSDSRRNVLMVRQNDVDHRKTTFANLLSCIEDLGLSDFFESRVQPLSITYKPTRQEIYFVGLNHPTSINSVSTPTGYLTDIYIEEAYEVTSYDAFLKLFMSLRIGKVYDDDGNIVKMNDIGTQMTLVLNSWGNDTWIYSEYYKGRLEDDFDKLDKEGLMEYIDPDFVSPGGKGLYLGIMSFKVNEFRQDYVDSDAAEMRKKNVEYFKTLYLGMWGAAGSQTYPEFKENNIINPSDLRSMPFVEFAIGIDTGLGTSEGGKQRVKKDEDASKIIRSATAMELCGVTRGYKKLIMIDEYYHSNSDPDHNTDNKNEMTILQIADACIDKIVEWIKIYGYAEDRGGNLSPQNGEITNYGMLMKGQITIFVDNADIGFRSILEMKARERGLYNLVILASTKRPVRSRIDFTRLMLSYGDYLISRNCKALIFEMKNAHADKDGNARADVSNHALDSSEYSWSQFMPMFNAYKMFNKDK